MVIGVIDYNMGNAQSVINAFEYVGAQALIIRNSQDVLSVDKIVLPGVGAFADGMNQLKELGFKDALNKVVLKEKKPFLGICLGMQLLFEAGEEFGFHAGLGWLSGRVKKFSSDIGLRIPHVGWNTITLKRKSEMVPAMCDQQDVYFVHSYHVSDYDEEICVATTTYGYEFPVIIESRNIFAVQFHPEKSQEIGLKIVRAFSKVRSDA